MKFSGKNVLITGASRGIGAQIARTLAGYGLKVWINYRSKPEMADALLEEIRANGGEGAVIKFDATNEAEFSEAIALIAQSDGELSYLVNNAGVTNDKLALRMKLEDFMGVIEANLMGNAGQVNYSASKGGMIAMSKSFAKEGAARGIRFNCITPGFIATDMTDALSDDVKASYEASIPLKRLGSTSDVAEGVAFLLSDGAGYITGETLKINGGLYM